MKQFIHTYWFDNDRSQSSRGQQEYTFFVLGLLRGLFHWFGTHAQLPRKRNFIDLGLEAVSLCNTKKGGSIDFVMLRDLCNFKLVTYPRNLELIACLETLRLFV